MEIIASDNTELLAQILSDFKCQSYVETALGLQDQLKKGIESGEIEAADTSVIDHFAPNVYLRQFDAKAGTLVVSKMHRTEHFIVFLTGSLSIATDDCIEHIKAPLIARTMPGTKRVVYFHEDSTCLTIHPTKLTDVDEIEKQIIVPELEISDFLKSIGHDLEEFTL